MHVISGSIAEGRSIIFQCSPINMWQAIMLDRLEVYRRFVTDRGEPLENYLESLGNKSKLNKGGSINTQPTL